MVAYILSRECLPDLPVPFSLRSHLQSAVLHVTYCLLHVSDRDSVHAGHCDEEVSRIQCILMSAFTTITFLVQLFDLLVA